MSVTLYLVIWEDRHVDVGVTVCATRELADRELNEWISLYDDDEFEELPVEGWVRNVESVNDDGPNGRIEQHEVVSE